MKRAAHSLLLLLLLSACQQHREPSPSTIFGTREETGGQVYDLPQIRDAGVLIGVTMSGPDTYYEYRGEGFGLQYLLAQEFASTIGATLQLEIVPDTASLFERLESHQADFICMETDSGQPWLTRDDTPLLHQAIAQWWNPERGERLRRQDSQLHVTRRRSQPVMRDRARGIISDYDDIFIRHSATIRWDWRLLAAQCYQESAFDPRALSWAGAKGLMQLMPATAAEMGVQGDKIFEPEANVAAGVRLLKVLSGMFADISDARERISFVLAAYNGGYNHVRDAMALTRKHGGNPQRWRDVATYILLLSDPAYYRDPVVRYGYLRGSETEAYVRLIMERWQQYRGSARSAGASSVPAPSKKSLRDGAFRSRVKSRDEWTSTMENDTTR